MGLLPDALRLVQATMLSDSVGALLDEVSGIIGWDLIDCWWNSNKGIFSAVHWEVSACCLPLQ